MTKASGVGERRKGRRSFSVSREMSVAFPRQTLSEDADPLTAGNLLSGRLGGDQGGSNLMPMMTMMMRMVMMMMMMMITKLMTMTMTLTLTTTMTAENDNDGDDDNDDDDDNGENMRRQ